MLYIFDGVRKHAAQIDRAAARLRAEPELIAAIIAVESSGRKFAKRFEPHIFHRLSGRRARTFRAAHEMHPEYALAACSVGLYQVMLMHAQRLGYDSATALHQLCMDPIRGPDHQTELFCRFIEATPDLRTAFAAGDLTRISVHLISAGYNGRLYHRGLYHAKLAREYRRRKGQTEPVILRQGDNRPQVVDLQERLAEAGMDIQRTGVFDAQTEAAVRQFQQDQRLTVDGVVGRNTWALLNLDMREPRPTAWERVRNAGTAVWVFITATGAAAMEWGMEIYFFLSTFGRFAADIWSFTRGYITANAMLIAIGFFAMALLAGLAMAAQRGWRAVRRLEVRVRPDPYAPTVGGAAISTPGEKLFPRSPPLAQNIAAGGPLDHPADSVGGVGVYAPSAGPGPEPTPTPPNPAAARPRTVIIDPLVANDPAPPAATQPRPRRPRPVAPTPAPSDAGD